MAQFEQHKFFCLNCGREGIPLSRKINHKHKAFHRKKLYCPWCRQEVNHVEVSTPEEEAKFKEEFEKGMYKDEAAETLAFIRASSEWQKHLGR